ncbi:MAG: ABC transporter permease [Bacteroidota bacterium]
MVANQLKMVLRSLVRNKTYTLLNLIGISTGLVVFLLITLYVQFEFSFDDYHEKKEQIFRVYKEDVGNVYQGTNQYAVIPGPLAAAMVADFPEVLAATTVDRQPNVLMRAGDQIFMEENIHAADPSIFAIFTFEVLAGNQEELLLDERSAVVSESMARKYFNRVDVVGESIRFRDETDFTISGVIADMPANSHFAMDIILNFKGMMKSLDRRIDRWSNSSFYCFALLSEAADPKVLQAQLPQLRAKYADDPIDEDGQESYFYLQALEDVHFTQNVNFDIAPSTSADDLYLYLFVAFMILFIASINYVNLATARAINRTREIGIRKVIGARSFALIRSFLLESGVLVTMALVMALMLTWIILPFFSDFVGKELPNLGSSYLFWWGIPLLGLLVTLISGLYPAWVMSQLQVVASLKGKKASAGSQGFRNALVVFQFAVSCVLILGALVLNDQLSYIRTMDRGYVKDQVVITYLRDSRIQQQFGAFRSELLKLPGVARVASSNSLPNNISSNSGVQWPGMPQDVDIPLYTNVIDYDYVDLYELAIAAGRNFDRKLDGQGAALLNEAAVKALGWEDPLNRSLITWFGDTVRVVGILKDFHQHSLHLAIEPAQFFLSEEAARTLSIRLETDHMEATLASIEEVYHGFDPAFPFDYNYFDDIFDSAYQSEIHTAILAEWFTGVAILIACLGLYGLAAHQVRRRLKEVGIRKVLGASVGRILILLTQDFGLLVAIAFLVAAPIAWYLMRDWLNGFAYHIDLTASSFLMALGLMILIAGLTVGYRTYSAAIRNPVEALREE